MKMKKRRKKKIWLSHTGVEGLNRCPRCFWLQYNRGIRQPEGIVSRLANRFDSIIKNYFNIYRELGELPPVIKGKIDGKLENPFTEAYFYHHDEDFGYCGLLDECLVTPDGLYTPLDHKTASSDPREKVILPAYQNQLNSYVWLLEENRKKTSGIGHLLYFYPDHSEKLHNGVKLVVHITTLRTNPDAAKNRFLEAIEVLKGPAPDSSAGCSFCGWYEKMKNEAS